MGEKILDWVQEHPGQATIVGLGLLVLILWLLGFFSSSKADTGGASNMAAAYYAAEAMQAQVGGAIQLASINATNATAQRKLETEAATAIASTQANAAQIINGQNTGAAMTINSQDTGAAIAIDAQRGYTSRIISNDQLQATLNANYYNYETVRSNNATAIEVNRSNNDASIFNNYLSTIVPAEIAAGNVYGQYVIDGHSIATGGPLANYGPAAFRREGYPESTIARIFDF